MKQYEQHLSGVARRVLKSLHKSYRKAPDQGAIYFNVASIQHELGLPWEQFEDAKLQLAKYRFVSYPPSDVERSRKEQIITITTQGVEAADRLNRRRWQMLRVWCGRLITILITSLIAALLAAWLVTNHGEWFRS
ncbi:MAG: hypothetical protein IID41_06110 [Planctomycetes bacterium]|nr:hypothetical protein [Planctomycetota bacterium]